jgi:nijmegen breakage syndrome protein 1
MGDGLNISVPEPPRRVGRSRRAVTSRFKGFDDAFDTPVAPGLESQVQESVAELKQPAEESLFVSQLESQLESQDVSMEQQAPQAQIRISHKRATSPVVEEFEAEDIMETLAPAAAQLKRRRLEETAARQLRGESTPPSHRSMPITRPTVSPPPQPKRIKKEVNIDVLEVARQRREQAAELARSEREALEEAMDGMDIDAIRKLAIIEEMPVERSMPPPARRIYGDESERWDDKWNGRKNFKKFRRRGAEGLIARVAKVIVPLEEVKKRDFGIGDDYWLEGGSRSGDRESQNRSERRGKKVPSARGSQAVGEISEASRANNSIGITQSGGDSSAAVVELSSDEEVLTTAGSYDEGPQEIQPTRSTRTSQPAPSASQASATSTRPSRSQRLTDQTNTDQGSSASSSRGPSMKRAATETLEKAEPGKRPKATPAPRAHATRLFPVISAAATAVARAPVRGGVSRRAVTVEKDDDDDEDEEEELGFRFRRKR